MHLRSHSEIDATGREDGVCVCKRRQRRKDNKGIAYHSIHSFACQPLEPFGLRRHTKPLSLSLSSRALTPLGGDDSDVRTNAASKGSAAALLVAELAGLLEAFGCEFLLRRQRQARQAKPSQKKKPKQACLPACLPACLL